MKIDAGVKNYYMRIVRGGEELKGIFTGNVVTKVDMSLITVPLQATYDICDNLRFKLGPYVSYVTSKKFEAGHTMVTCAAKRKVILRAILPDKR